MPQSSTNTHRGALSRGAGPPRFERHAPQRHPAAAAPERAQHRRPRPRPPAQQGQRRQQRGRRQRRRRVPPLHPLVKGRRRGLHLGQHHVSLPGEAQGLGVVPALREEHGVGQRGMLAEAPEQGASGLPVAPRVYPATASCLHPAIQAAGLARSRWHGRRRPTAPSGGALTCLVPCQGAAGSPLIAAPPPHDVHQLPARPASPTSSAQRAPTCACRPPRVLTLLPPAASSQLLGAAANPPCQPDKLGVTPPPPCMPPRFISCHRWRLPHALAPGSCRPDPTHLYSASLRESSSRAVRGAFASYTLPSPFLLSAVWGCCGWEVELQVSRQALLPPGSAGEAQAPLASS